MTLLQGGKLLANRLSDSLITEAIAVSEATTLNVCPVCCDIGSSIATDDEMLSNERLCQEMHTSWRVVSP